MIRNIFKILTATVFLILVGCGQKKEIKGDEFIHRDTLVQVIADIHLLDGITNDIRFYRKYNPVDSIDLHSGIFEKYGITKEMYEHTIAEYSRYPKLLKAVYDDVMMNLNMMLDKEKTNYEAEQNEKKAKGETPMEDEFVY